jgi:hypothetical protein
VSVKTWSRIPNEHEHVVTNTDSSQAIKRNEADGVLLSSLLEFLQSL